MIKTIEPHDLDVEVHCTSSPCLIAFLKRNERSMTQRQILDAASQDMGDKLRYYLYHEDYLDTAMQQYLVKGTPTFLLFAQGREVGRLIGESDRETLDEFVSAAITRGNSQE